MWMSFYPGLSRPLRLAFGPGTSSTAQASVITNTAVPFSYNKATAVSLIVFSLFLSLSLSLSFFLFSLCMYIYIHLYIYIYVYKCDVVCDT